MDDATHAAWERIEDGSRRLQIVATEIDAGTYQRDALKVCRQVNAAMTQLQEIASSAVEVGIRAGETQKALALALGVPPSTLAGAKREFSS